MTGGLLQIISSGKQDIYLTVKPEVTFFKKVFRRHTNFSTELVRINPEQISDYDNMVTFILNTGDCVHRCYIEIDLPILSFSDKMITNTNYINMKSTKISNINNLITKYTTYYTNLKGFVDIEAQLYRTIYNLLDSDNITINLLKDTVNNFNQINKTNKNFYKNKLDASVYNMINITGYISSINLLLTSKVTYDATLFIGINIIKSKIKEMYGNMVTNLAFYNKMIVTNTNQLNKLNSNNMINFNFAEYLGHNFFEYFNLEIGGVEINRYSNDVLHINQLHHMKPDFIDNYYNMIGHTSSLNAHNVNPKGGNKLLIPLIFWFNKNAGSSLPLVALRNTTVSISAKVTNLYNLICFEDYAIHYNSIVNIDIDIIDKFNLDTNLIYSEYKYDLEDRKINYKCLYINSTLLSYQFPDLTTEEINLILTSVGTQYTKNQITKILNPTMDIVDIAAINGNSGEVSQYLINMNQWITLMINIKSSVYSNVAPKIATYYPYINYDLYYSMIPKPNINMVVESVFLDDIERYKFASSKLEYVVEIFAENQFNIPNQTSFDCELSFLNPSKELIWYCQPKVYKERFTPYGKNNTMLFDTSTYFKNELIKNQTLIFDKYDVLLDRINSDYYTYLLSYRYLNNILPTGLFYQSFCLYPEETQPSGTANMRELKGKLYKIVFSKDFLAEYKSLLEQFYGVGNAMVTSKLELSLKFISKNYDMFIVHKGQGKLLFSY
jgi:hypothetical protein